MDAHKILIVEDELIGAASLELDLKRMGYQVVGIASSGTKAIQLAAQTRPEVILMDIALKGEMDGITAAIKIRLVQDCSIVFLTSFSDPETLERAKSLNPEGYIVKPYRKPDLQSVITSVLKPKQPDSFAKKIHKNQRRAKIGVFKAKNILKKLPNNSQIHLEQYRKRQQYQKRLPLLPQEDQEILQELQHTGFYQTTLDKLNLPNHDFFCQTIDKLIPELSTRSSQGLWALRCPRERKILYPQIVFWGLQKRLLDIAESYVGLPLLFQGVDLRRDIANGPLNGPQRWHRDIDDVKMIKFLIYLSDVGAGSGPFEFIPRSFSFHLNQALNYDSGFVTDEDISLIVPEQHWMQCYGKKWTLLMVDPCSIFHRAQPATNRDRLSITFGFTSRQPQIDLSEFSLSHDEWKRFRTRLEARQMACLRRRA